ncbi:type II toxin-antitoxin system VapC family toxin [Thiocystis violacea]|uniref:type II toxin-antitoxin system VapC family toxin n=1 Tax=Thiocystis violacea TaxID=13725 RepID=UPI00190679B9|nr:type II toxin-antitoxin system VapC family toxin [Thiocystis violacea]MBK1717778.1 VapC toxin family PIN domain ribonuclease [Thiocystis violacea]
MVIDTSSLICILLNEPEAEQHARRLVEAEASVMSAVTWLETLLVITARRGDVGRKSLAELLDLAGVTILPVDADLAHIAYRAWLEYGKGRHPAGLNFGDCFSYALAKHRHEPLLFKGNDFSQTDLLTAI